MPHSVSATHHSEFFFKAEGECFRAEGFRDRELETRAGQSLQEKDCPGGTKHRALPRKGDFCR